MKVTHFMWCLRSTSNCSKRQQSFAKWNQWNRFLRLIRPNSQCELYLCLIYDSSPESGLWPILLDALALCRYTSQLIGTKWLLRKWAVSLLLSQEGKHPLQSGFRLWIVNPRQVTVWITCTASVAAWVRGFGYNLPTACPAITEASKLKGSQNHRMIEVERGRSHLV